MNKDFEVIDESLEAGKKALQSYSVGFVFSLLLTIAPYYIVTRHVFETRSLTLIVAFFAVIQLLVQVVYFLHLNKKSKPHWNMVVFFFTLLIVLFLVVGSLWIMYHLNVNMTGMSPFSSNEGYIPQ